MVQQQDVDPVAALDAVFAIIREEAVASPRFAARLLDALGAQVVFRGSDAVASVDPILVALKGHEEFRQTFISFKPADLKKMVIDFNLATKSDLTGKNKGPQIVELMWRGAQAKLHDLGLKPRE